MNGNWNKTLSSSRASSGFSQSGSDRKAVKLRKGGNVKVRKGRILKLEKGGYYS
jgi:hypothetical protein